MTDAKSVNRPDVAVVAPGLSIDFAALDKPAHRDGTDKYGATFFIRNVAMHGLR